jgi:hypothetical protein
MDVLDYLYINGNKTVKSPVPDKETKTDVDGFYKTPSGAVVCKDNNSLNAYKLRKAKSIQLNTMKDDIDQLKTDMTEIKELLKGLVK